MVLERIKQYLDYKNISISAFEKSIGMSNASFRKSLKRKGAIGSDKIENILRVYSDLSPAWLFSGKGDMIVNGSYQLGSEKDSSDNKDEFTAEPLPLDGYYKKSIPLIPLNKDGGTLLEKIKAESNCERYIIPAFDDADFLFTIRGTSMLPAFRPGDIVACKNVPLTALFFQWNNIYVMDTSQGILVKRVKPGKDKKHVLIVSEDDAYDPFELSCSNIHSLALVVGIIRSMI
jgi:SOS-response transcriptional repressor LexA